MGLLSVAISSNDNIRYERVVLLRFRFRFFFIGRVNSFAVFWKKIFKISLFPGKFPAEKSFLKKLRALTF